MLPFALLPVVYHAFHEPHTWPSTYELLGRGDIALVVAAVIGATIAELVQPSVLNVEIRAVLISISSLGGFTSIVIYAIAQYQTLAGQAPDERVNTFLLLSLLFVSVIIQVVLIYKRQVA
jgi:hypothetical protein